MVEYQSKKVHEIIDRELYMARGKRTFCKEHNFELERLAYQKLCEVLDDINLQISNISIKEDYMKPLMEGSYKL